MDTVPAFAQTPAPSGNDCRGAGGGSQQIECAIYNVLTHFFQQILTVGQSQNDKLQQQIDLQKQIINNQETEISLLKQIILQQSVQVTSQPQINSKQSPPVQNYGQTNCKMTVSPLGVTKIICG